MIDSNYLTLKEKIFAVLNNGLSIVSLADCLSCTPAALQLWLEGEDNIELNSSIYAFLIKEMVKGELLDIPVLRITPFVFIEKVIFEAMCNPGVYALVGASGIGKTASLLECYIQQEGVKFLYSPEELYKLSIPDFSIICIDNAETITIDQAEIASRFVDKNISVLLSGTPRLIEKISKYDKLSSKTVIRDVPGIDQEDVKVVLDQLFPDTIEDSIVKKLEIICIPSIARLTLLLKEAYRIMKNNHEKTINLNIISEAKDALIMEGAKW